MNYEKVITDALNAENGAHFKTIGMDNFIQITEFIEETDETLVVKFRDETFYIPKDKISAIKVFNVNS